MNKSTENTQAATIREKSEREKQCPTSVPLNQIKLLNTTTQKMLSSEIFTQHGYLQLMFIEADAGAPMVSSKSSCSNPSSSISGESSFLLPQNPSSRQFYARASLKDSGGSESLHTFTTGLHQYVPQHKIM